MPYRTLQFYFNFMIPITTSFILSREVLHSCASRKYAVSRFMYDAFTANSDMASLSIDKSATVTGSS